MCVICLCADWFGLGWAHDAICFAYHMFMHFPCIRISLFNILLLFELLGTFLIFFLSLPLLFTLVVSMTPKRKSTPTRNLFHSGASSSSNSAPLSLRFRDDDAHKAFSENFSRWGVHSEHQVILADIADIDLPTVIHSREWESLCDVPITCPLVLIQEFYSNMREIDHSVPFLFTHDRGTRIPSHCNLLWMCFGSLG